MNKLNNRLGISIGILVVILIGLMSFGSDIEALNKGQVFTPSGLGDGVFFSMSDFLIYNVFIVGCVLAVIYLCLSIGKRSSKS